MTDRLKAFKRALLNGSLPPYTEPDWKGDPIMLSGFELGFLKVVTDDAYYKATKRKRDIVVYTTPEERAKQHQLK